MKIMESRVASEHNIPEVIEKMRAIGKDKVRFVILYGSAAKGKLTKLSDIDIAVFFNGDKSERFEFRKKILGRVSNEFDIQIFQDLPLYVQKDILSTGKVMYSDDYIETFEIFMKTIRGFEDFKPRLEVYYSGLGV
jgi:predicted nucleotidyltransferase